MAYDSTKPANDGYLAEFPPEMREQLRAIINDQIVDALKLKGLSPGNLSGNIPVSNGTLCNNLNADKLDGNDAAAFAVAGHTHSAATASTNGFMSNTDKAKLDGIEASADVNQMAFSNVKVGTTTIQADSVTDTLELIAGTNIALTPDATNDRVTVAVTGTVASATTATNATNHINASSGAHAASAIGCTATGDVAATNVQAAIAELANEKVPTSDVVTSATANKLLKLNSSGALPASVTGNAATATTASACSGNAATATKLQTARSINGVSFDGSTSINITQVGGKDIIADDDHSFTQNGYQKLNNGLIIQWGETGSLNVNTAVAVNLPIVFPRACLNIVTNIHTVSPNTSGGCYLTEISSVTASSFVITRYGGANMPTVYWFAIGY